MVRKISLLPITRDFLNNKKSVFGSLFHKICKRILYTVHEHVFTCINIRVLRDNWILVLPIGLYTRITDHD